MIKNVLAGGALAMAMTGCMLDDGELTVHVAEVTSDLYVNSSWTWANGEVPVCWEDMNPAFASEREWVRLAVESTWQREARVHFSGWGQCDWYLWTNPQVRIRISDETPHTVNLGTLMGHQYGGLTLNFTFNSWSPSCQSDTKGCIQKIAAHEFGHVLGFAHEQNRPDRPASCNDVQGNGADWTIGPWDLNSIMNYCNPMWNNNGKLSPGDIVGVQTVYGKRINSIVGVNSMCLVAPGGAQDTTMDHCAPAPAQQFSLAPYTAFPAQITNRNGQLLDAWAWGTASGTPIRSWTANQPATPNQQWNFVDVALRGLGGKCLTAPTPGTSGSFVVQLPCDGRDAQKWTFTSAGEIRTKAGKCLDAQWGATSDGTRIWIWDCNNGPAQKWNSLSNVIIGPGSKCLDVMNGDTADNNGLWLWPCSSSLAQKWSLVGQIRTALAGARCINAATSFLGAGPAMLWDCFTAPAETWEFFP